MTTRHGRNLRRNRRGYSALIATIIMVLVVLFLYFNVFMTSLNRNTDYQDAISRSNQLDADKQTELMSVTVFAYARLIPLTTIYKVYCPVTDNGPLPLRIVRIYIHGLPQGDISYAVPTPNVLQPGTTLDVMSNILVYVSPYSTVRALTLTLVTSRGNLVPSTVTVQ